MSRAVWAARLVVFAAFIVLLAGFPIVAPYARDLDASAWLGGVVVAAYSMASRRVVSPPGPVPLVWNRLVPG